MQIWHFIHPFNYDQHDQHLYVFSFAGMITIKNRGKLSTKESEKAKGICINFTIK